jgi:hypothetical protein
VGDEEDKEQINIQKGEFPPILTQNENYLNE